MTDADTLKQACALAKRSVTCAARKLLTSAKLGADTSILRNQAEALETAYDKFHLCHLEYCDVVNQEDYDYLEHASTEYMEARTAFQTALCASENIAIERKATPLRKAFQRSTARLNSVLDRMEGILADSSVASSDDINDLRQDKDEVDSLLHSILEDLSKLNAVVLSDKEEDLADAIVIRTDQAKRKANLAIRKFQNNMLSLPTPFQLVNNSPGPLAQGRVIASPQVSGTSPSVVPSSSTVSGTPASAASGIATVSAHSNATASTVSTSTAAAVYTTAATQQPVTSQVTSVFSSVGGFTSPTLASAAAQLPSNHLYGPVAEALPTKASVCLHGHMGLHHSNPRQLLRVTTLPFPVKLLQLSTPRSHPSQPSLATGLTGQNLSVCGGPLRRHSSLARCS